MLHPFLSNIILQKRRFFGKQCRLNHVIFLLHNEFATLFFNFLFLECLNFLQIKRLVLEKCFQLFSKKNKMWIQMIYLAFFPEKHRRPPLKLYCHETFFIQLGI